MRIENFGRNTYCEPKHFYAPTSVDEILEILARHSGERIRVIGRMHSWSDAPLGNDVLLDLRNLNGIQVELRDGQPWAIIQAGCQIKKVLAELEAQHGLTLPTLGLITEQTIAGAAATGTHGSGRHSLSHYIDEATIARYDAKTGKPICECIQSGQKLAAARCALGCLGVVLSVGIRCRPQYNIEQHFRWAVSLEDALGSENEYPLQQFFLMPFRWDYLLQLRKETQKSLTPFTWIHRLYWFLGMDIALHSMLIFMRRWLRSEWLIRLFYKRIVPAVLIRGWKVVDKSKNLLTMEHELFRHIEIEIFVLQSELRGTLHFVHQLLEFLQGNREAIDNTAWNRLRQHSLERDVRECKHYMHHYPICIRKVLGDDTLISMASSDGDPYYAISFISYDRPKERQGFFAFAELLTSVTSRLFNARPHWGKYYALDALEGNRLYPKLRQFQETCDACDPRGVFRNVWAERTLFK